MSVNSLRRIGVLCLAAIAFAGCGSAEESTRPSKMTPGDPTKAVCPPDPTLTYATFGEPFMKKYCLQCHSEKLSASMRMAAPLGTDYDTVEDIRMLAASIDRWAAIGPAAQNRKMPMPTAEPKPTDEERTQLGVWLACGAP
jgi:uncharacterized membrane protein